MMSPTAAMVMLVTTSGLGETVGSGACSASATPGVVSGVATEFREFAGRSTRPAMTDFLLLQPAVIARQPRIPANSIRRGVCIENNTSMSIPYRETDATTHGITTGSWWLQVHQRISASRTERSTSLMSTFPFHCFVICPSLTRIIVGSDFTPHCFQTAEVSSAMG